MCLARKGFQALGADGEVVWREEEPVVTMFFKNTNINKIKQTWNVLYPFLGRRWVFVELRGCKKPHEKYQRLNISTNSQRLDAYLQPIISTSTLQQASKKSLIDTRIRKSLLESPFGIFGFSCISDGSHISHHRMHPQVSIWPGVRLERVCGCQRKKHTFQSGPPNITLLLTNITKPNMVNAPQSN